MKCPNCQYDNPGIAKFCGECGTTLEIKCQNCGKQNPPSNKFCFECGHKLDESVEPTKTLKLNDPQSYIPKHLAEKILRGKSSLEGERKQVTVLFADASGFTAMSEKIDPEEVRALMNNCLELVIEAVHNYEGTINKFTGDGLMALFGAPIALEDHPYRAVSAALRIQESLKSFGKEIKKKHGFSFKMRIGINTGLVVVGSIGNDLNMEYTAMGDTVNLASRLEGLAEPGAILISENSYQLVKDYFDCRAIGEVTVKGKSVPVKAYTAIGLKGRKGRFEVSLERGLTKFVGREKELELIKNSLEKIKDEKGQIVGIIGEAGIGKSRLVYEFKSLIGDDEINYLEGHCISYGSSLSYLPIVEILKNNFSIDDRDDDEGIKVKVEAGINKINGKLKDTTPLLLDLFSVKTDYNILKHVDAEQKRHGIFEILKAILLRESQIKPTVITIEDLHWIDKTSEDFLNHLSGSISNHRIMLLFTSRPGFVHHFVDKPNYTQIALSSFSSKDCIVLVESMLNGKNVPKDFMKIILEKSGGNAFFVEEVIRSLL
ncbi:MAG TPA: adenylate/guanylate cyclase domain-containing protein, partial [Thermodesulfobacteriota bacterium]